MKSKEFLTEDELENDEELQQQIQLIQRDCQPYIQQANGNTMYRGIKSNQNFMKKQSRLDDRRPLDSVRKNHDLFNKQFLQKYGENFRNSVFTNGDTKIAKYYGDVYSVFPIGNFKFLWSPKVKDLGEQFTGKSSNLFLYAIQSLLYNDEHIVNHFIKEADYRTTDLAAAIKSGNEIMIYCKEYYVLR